MRVTFEGTARVAHGCCTVGLLYPLSLLTHVPSKQHMIRLPLMGIVFSENSRQVLGGQGEMWNV